MSANRSDKHAHPRRALVTGGATGIGWAISRALAAQGLTIALADINIAAARDRVAELGQGHVALDVDLSDLSAAATLPERAAQALGGLDVIVNNAGITDTSGRRIGEIPDTDFDRLVAVNLGSVEAICRAGQVVLGQGGVTVNLASGAAYRALPLRGAYSATKAGVVALTEMMNSRARPLGQRVCAVAPGYVRTELVESLIANGRLDPVVAASTIPLGRLGTPEDIAQGVAFLASPLGAVMAGKCLAVDGGTGASGGATVQPQDAGYTDAPEGGRLVVIGASSDAARVADTLDDASHVETVADLGTFRSASAVIDLGGLTAMDTASALARARAIAGQIEELAPPRGFTLLMSVRATDPVVTAAMDMMARLLAIEWGSRGYRVNTIGWSGDSLDGLAGLAAYLTSGAAGYVTGQLIRAGAEG
ncbi:SDR family oxidoreductase [Pseudooceanicola onchidii]|uniref:SDR family oxidoreductase n=1 Tax=Pseudooceanicola onchidii TaxID=2562279 RepID=UPI0010A9F059|nr:SDR family oxidoreductase [Pseudooceanicola onchidii]